MKPLRSWLCEIMDIDFVEFPSLLKKLVRWESAKPTSSLAWPPVPRWRPRHIMMGTKVRSFSPLPHDISLEDLVPEDHFYRRLEAALDLSFVRDLVEPLYAKGGRPSVDPVVFFKLQLVMFFENLRSERQLMRAVADRLSVRWSLG